MFLAEPYSLSGFTIKFGDITSYCLCYDGYYREIYEWKFNVLKFIIILFCSNDDHQMYISNNNNPEDEEDESVNIL